MYEKVQPEGRDKLTFGSECFFTVRFLRFKRGRARRAAGKGMRLKRQDGTWMPAQLKV
jgi:hypothetical protein